MQHTPIDKDNLIKNLIAVAPKHCDNCGARYTENNFKVVKSTATNTIFHLTCSVCKNSYMLNVLNPVNGMIGAQRTPINIDLDLNNELEKFAGKPGVEKDEAIDIYNYLAPNLTEKDLKIVLDL